jgi:hypothetical protein
MRLPSGINKSRHDEALCPVGLRMVQTGIKKSVRLIIKNKMTGMTIQDPGKAVVCVITDSSRRILWSFDSITHQNQRRAAWRGSPPCVILPQVDPPPDSSPE